MISEKRFQLYVATQKIYDLMDHNPEIMNLGHCVERTRSMIAQIFMEVAGLHAPDLDGEDLVSAFAQAINNYNEKLAEPKDEERAKENEEWEKPKNGSRKSSVH